MIRPSWVIPIKNRTVSSVILSLPSNHFKDLTVGHKVTLFLKVLLHSIKLWLGIYSTQKFNQGMKNLEHRTAYQAWLLFNLGSYHIREKVGVCLVCLKLLSSIQSWTFQWRNNKLTPYLTTALNDYIICTSKYVPQKQTQR